MPEQILYKVFDKDKITGVLTADKVFIPKTDLNNHMFVNTQVSKDNKILAKLPEVDVSSLKSLGIFMLYHGSHSQIQGTVSPYHSRVACDFGQGFYLGEIKEQAESIVATDSNPTVYRFLLNTKDLRVYKFTNYLAWTLYVGVKREVLKPTPKLQTQIDSIDKNDIIIGRIADDRMFYVFNRFIQGEITDRVLMEALKYVKLGDQYVCKTQKACSALSLLNTYTLDNSYKKQLLKDRSKLIGTMPQTVEGIIRQYRRQGKYIDEVMNQWQ